jgi:L-alanine-DL-glutamate epimerase-like enolase superfamily enzyme
VILTASSTTAIWLLKIPLHIWLEASGSNIINGRLEVENGSMPVPSSPGIGMSLNQAFIESVTQSKAVLTA